VSEGHIKNCLDKAIITGNTLILAVSQDDDEEELRKQINQQLDKFKIGKLGDIWPDDSTCPNVNCHRTRVKKKLFSSDYWYCEKCDK